MHTKNIISNTKEFLEGNEFAYHTYHFEAVLALITKW